jgi:DNA invertase Pin-like site-specific DNA recombinase
MHPKVKPSHLERIAFLYLRQSSPQQLIDHQESLRVQLGLKEILHQWGFPRVEVIDTDLGKSASGYAQRLGFNAILNNVCLERAGAVAAWEASRLARSHFEWQKLTRFCQITDTLVVDESGVYDPTNIDDIAMLGIKATMAEHELNMLTKRARAGVLEKAKRGELRYLLPIGCYWTEDGQIEMEPDEHVQKTLYLMFGKFDELGTARQVHLWFLDNKIEFPVVHYHRGGRRTITWEQADYQIIRDALKNPTYAGAYAWGRRETRTFIRDQQPAKTAGHPLPMEKWIVLIPNHHPGYISWEKFLKNQEQIRENANKLSPFSKGAAKKGKSLLAGLIHCGHCGHKLAVKYRGRDGKSIGYLCFGNFNKTGQTYKCFSTSARKLEAAIVQEVLKTIQPAAITAAIDAEKKLAAERSERQQHLELAFEQARYEADRRRRQFDAVEPENRPVIREVQALWKQALTKVEALEQELQQEKANHRPFDESKRQQLYELANDLPRLWNLPSTDERSKTLIIRTLIEDIIARTEPDRDYNCFTIHWAGGVHSEIRLKRNKPGEHGRKTNVEVIELVKELAAITDDGDIARILNRCGLKTATGKNWNQGRVKALRRLSKIPAFSEKADGKADNINLHQAAAQLQISPDAVLRLIKSGLLKAKQIVRYAPWIIHKSELEKPQVVEAVKRIKKNGKAKIQLNQKELTL